MTEKTQDDELISIQAVWQEVAEREGVQEMFVSLSPISEKSSIRFYFEDYPNTISCVTYRITKETKDPFRQIAVGKKPKVTLVETIKKKFYNLAGIKI